MKTELYNECKKIDINLSNETLEKFDKYYKLVVYYNKMINLTAITEENKFLYKHFLDSIIGQKYIKQNSKVCDIGAGAGFPSIPLKLVRDDLDFTLIDSLNKRVKFLNTVIDELDLTEIKAVHSRAEDAGNKIYREQFDYVVARAVAPLNILLEYCIPLLKVGGSFIAYKGNSDEEIKKSKNALKLLNAKIIKTEKFILPNTDFNRTLIVIKKTGKTNKIYPRSQNKPKSNPL